MTTGPDFDRDSVDRNPADPILTAVQKALVPGLKPGARVLIGLSGGLDSMALLHALAKLREPMNFGLSALHVHHGLSPHADAWASFCTDQCKALGVNCQVMRVDIAQDQGKGLEQAAREKRYAALASASGDVLCLAHHQNDRAETLLLNLFRGASATGLAGVPGSRWLGDKRLVRPLMGVTRPDLAAWVTAQGLHWIEDESNLDLRYRRNFVRHRVLPVIADSFPGVVKVLARTASQMQEQLALIDRLAEIDGERCRGPSGYLSVGSLQGLPEPAVRNVLRYALTRTGLQIPSAQRLQTLAAQLMTARPEAEVFVRMGEVGVHLWRDQIWLDTVIKLPLPETQLLRVGESVWPDGTLQVNAAGAEPMGLEVRPLGRGQQFQPAARCRDTVTEHLRAKGVPPWVRPRLPGVWFNGKLVWVAVLGQSSDWMNEARQALDVTWIPSASVRL